MKKIFIVALSFICLICAGCFQAEFDLIITSDGAVVQNSKFIGNALVIQQIEDWKTQNEKLNPNLNAKPVSEGDMLGYEFSVQFSDLENFAKAGGTLFEAHAGKNKGISRHKSWLFDEYDFDFYWKSPSANLPPESDFMAQTAFSGVVFDMTIQLPYSAENQNADEISDDGKVLKWNLAPVLIRGGERHMNARFKIWHKDKIALTATVELLLLAAAIFFFVKARAETFEDISKDLRFKRNVFAGLFIALAIISAYQILAPVTFTDADIISAAAQ